MDTEGRVSSESTVLRAPFAPAEPVAKMGCSSYVITPMTPCDCRSPLRRPNPRDPLRLPTAQPLLDNRAA